MATHSKTHNSVNRKLRLARRRRAAEVKLARLGAAAPATKPLKPSRH